MLTKIIVKGNITRIIKIDNSCTKLVIATNVFNRGEDGVLNKKGTIWTNFVYFDDHTEFLKVGMYVTIEGHLTLRKDKEISNEFVADYIYLDLAAEEKRLKSKNRKRDNAFEMEELYNNKDNNETL